MFINLWPNVPVNNFSIMPDDVTASWALTSTLRSYYTLAKCQLGLNSGPHDFKSDFTTRPMPCFILSFIVIKINTPLIWPLNNPLSHTTCISLFLSFSEMSIMTGRTLSTPHSGTTVVCVVGLIVHDEFVFHEVETVRSGVIRTIYHLLDCKIGKKNEPPCGKTNKVVSEQV